MTAQVTVWRTNGTFVEYPASTDDAGRGQTLLSTVNAANAGDMVMVGPGNYLKPYPNDITKDGVRLHLLPGARIYDTNHRTNVPVINVTSGTHWVSGHGIIEHQCINPGGGSAAAGIVVRNTGTLICEVDEIISTTALNSAVKVADPPPASPTLYIQARKSLAMDYDALEVGNGFCFARVQHAVSAGDTDANAIEVSGTADAGHVRVIEVQRAESNQGYTLNLASGTAQAVYSLHCQSVFAFAAVPMRCSSPAHYTRLGHISAGVGNLQTVQMATGRVMADQIEQHSDGTALEVNIGTKLFAHLVSTVGANTNGIKVLNTFADHEAIIDVGQIHLHPTATYSVFADNPNTSFAIIRDFRSTKPISTNSPPLSHNHP